MDWWPQLEILAGIALAMLLGGLIGIEREIANKPAGFRTHMLVAAAAALLVSLSDALVNQFNIADTDYMRTDPIRIVEAIITGVSFLGAGTIFRHRASKHVEGLTTAASVLLSSAVGVAVAVEQYVLAVGMTLLTLLVLRGLTVAEKVLGSKQTNKIKEQKERKAN